MAYNNTYGIQAIDEATYNSAMQNYTKPGGCRDLIVECRAAAAKGDVDDEGNNVDVNAICGKADNYCSNYVEGAYYEVPANPRGYYDIAHLQEDPFPPEYFLGYLLKADVQQAIGVKVNFSESINSVYYAFGSTGDYPRGGFLEDLQYVLSRGVKVAMVYGDRDYACNWYGGEAVSLALNHTGFAEAGYTDLVVNSTYIGGQTRQAGNLSFTRVYEAGHEVPAYQPETAYELFYRALANKDIATGKIDYLSQANFSTTGTKDTLHIRNVDPGAPAPTCYVLSPGSCTSDQWEQVESGKGLIKDYILQDSAVTGGNGTSGSGANGTVTSALPSPTGKSAAGSVKYSASILLGALSLIMIAL